MAGRTEFGVPRSVCGCENCKTNCRFMPGYLIPADLNRMIPVTTVDVFAWAEKNLLASPGALVAYKGNPFRIHTLVPATKQDGTCINLQADGKCAIHAVAPFGCAFFSCGQEPAGLSAKGLIQINQNWVGGLYGTLWAHLYRKGLVSAGPEVLRARMRAAMQEEGTWQQ